MVSEQAFARRIIAKLKGELPPISDEDRALFAQHHIELRKHGNAAMVFYDAR